MHLKDVVKNQENLRPRNEPNNPDHETGLNSIRAHDPIAELNALSQFRTRASVAQLERMADCIKQLCGNDAYKNDPRFLKICLEYGSYSESPGLMFDFMNAAGIGTQRATFFYHWANFLETVGKIDAAKRIVRRGLEAGAQPQILLTQLEADLQDRHPNHQAARASMRSLARPPRADTKLRVYSGGSESDDDDSAIAGFPNYATMHKENKAAVEQLNVTARSVSSHPGAHHPALVRQVFVGSDDDSDDEMAYEELLLEKREFGPLRPFDAHPRPITVRAMKPHEPQFAGLHHLMYEQHNGVTEPIGAARFAYKGDTEVLN